MFKDRNAGKSCSKIGKDLEGHQGQIIFSSMFMFDGFEFSSKPNNDSLYIYYGHLQYKIC